MRRVDSREVHYPVDAGRLGVADVIRVVHMLLPVSQLLVSYQFIATPRQLYDKEETRKLAYEGILLAPNDLLPLHPPAAPRQEPLAPGREPPPLRRHGSQHARRPRYLRRFAPEDDAFPDAC